MKVWKSILEISGIIRLVSDEAGCSLMVTTTLFFIAFISFILWLTRTIIFAIEKKFSNNIPVKL